MQIKKIDPIIASLDIKLMNTITDETLNLKEKLVNLVKMNHMISRGY